MNLLLSTLLNTSTAFQIFLYYYIQTRIFYIYIVNFFWKFKNTPKWSILSVLILFLSKFNILYNGNKYFLYFQCLLIFPVSVEFMRFKSRESKVSSVNRNVRGRTLLCSNTIIQIRNIYKNIDHWYFKFWCEFNHISFEFTDSIALFHLARDKKSIAGRSY